MRRVVRVKNREGRNERIAIVYCYWIDIIKIRVYGICGIVRVALITPIDDPTPIINSEHVEPHWLADWPARGVKNRVVRTNTPSSGRHTRKRRERRKSKWKWNACAGTVDGCPRPSSLHGEKNIRLRTDGSRWRIGVEKRVSCETGWPTNAIARIR